MDNKEKRQITENAVKEMNQNSNLGYDLLSLYEDSIIEKINKECKNYVNNYMSDDYYGNGISWIFSGYPHDESPNFLTYIEFNSIEYNVFGIKPGDNISDSKNILEKMGFENKGHYSKKNRANVFSKGDLYISLITKNDNLIIENIEIEARTFYLGNKLY